MFRKPTLAALALLVLSASLSFGFIRKPGSHEPSSQTTYPITVHMRKYPAWMEIPIQVAEIRVKGKRVELDSPFLHTEDWLRDFSVVVKNTSERPILGLRLTLEWTSDPGDGIPYIPETLIYAGQQFLMGSDGPGAKLVLNSGETMELFVEQAWWESHNKHIAGTAHSTHKQIPSTIRRSATLNYEYVGFDPDTAWASGLYVHRDPNNKDVFIPDKPQPKKISQILTQELGPARMLKAKYRLGATLPGCQQIDTVGHNQCTEQNCPGQSCRVLKDITHDESPGFTVVNKSEECEKFVGAVITPCGCCQLVKRIIFNQPC